MLLDWWDYKLAIGLNIYVCACKKFNAAELYAL
jgi:hypothetical protein